MSDYLPMIKVVLLNPRAFSVRADFRGRKMALARAWSSLGSRRWPSHCQLIRNVNETKRRTSIADGPYRTQWWATRWRARSTRRSSVDHRDLCTIMCTWSMACVIVFHSEVRRKSAVFLFVCASNHIDRFEKWCFIGKRSLRLWRKFV